MTESPANQVLLQMIRRKVHVLVGNPLLRTYDILKKVFKNSPELAAQTTHRQMLAEYRLPVQLTFTDSENKAGQKLLLKMGLPDGAPYICFHSRDKMILQSTLKYRTAATNPRCCNVWSRPGSSPTEHHCGQS